jgi:hypothetical protein
VALVLADRVQQTGTANTTVSFTLSGSVTGFQSFAVVGNGNTTYYSAFDPSGNWEVGIGTYSTTGPTLTRTTVVASSNSGSAVTFSGTVNVFLTYPAEYAAWASNNPGTSGYVLTSNGTGVAPSWQAGGVGTITTTDFTATASQTTFTVSYTPGLVEVYQNGAKLGNADYTATNGTSIVLGTGATVGDLIEVVAFSNLNLATAVNSISFGSTGLTPSTATSGAVTVAGTLAIANGGTNSTATPTAGGAGYGTGTAHAYTAAGTSGQPLISAGASAPAFGTLALGTANTNVSGALTVTNGGTGVSTLTGIVKGTGTTAFTAATAGTDYSAGTSALTTGILKSTTTTGALSIAVAADFPTLNQNTTGTASNVTGTVAVGNGGTGATTFTANGILYGNTTSAIGVTAAGTTGQVLTANTGAAPTWGAAPGATITGTTTAGTYYIVGTTSTSGTLSTASISNTNAVSYNASTGALTAVSVVSSSDERLKKNWQSVNLDFVDKLAYVKHGTFERISSGNREVGVTAQSLKEVLPEAIIESEEGLLGVNYGGAALVAAIELAKEVKLLRAEIIELKAELNK